MKELTGQDVIDRLKSLITADRNRTKLSEEIGVSRPYLSDVMGNKKPPPKRVLDYLGLEKCEAPVTYKEK